MFTPIPYLDWIMGRPEQVTYDLGSSDLRANGPATGVVPPSLADRSDPPADVTLESRLASIYGVDTDSVFVTAGATHANFLAAVAALKAASYDNPRVLVEKPGYQPLVETPRAVGAHIDRFLRPVEDDCRLDPNRVDAAISRSTALVTITNRHNPSGRLVERDTLAAVADVAAERDVPLLIDEVYGPFVEEPRTTHPAPFGGVSAAGLPNTLVTGSLTKFHGLGGVRIGWLVGDADFVDRVRSAADHVPAVSEPSRVLARRALAHDDLVSESRDHLCRNHELLADFVADRDDLSGHVHDGCSFAFLAHESADGDEVVEAALDRDVLVVPGRFFDRNDSFRLSLGRAPEEVETGLAVLGDVLDDLVDAE